MIYVKSFNCISLQKASGNLNKIYASVLANVDLKITQFRIIRNIQKFCKTNISGLSYLLELDRTTVLRNIEKFIKLDLVSYRCINNGKIIQLTTVSKTNLEKYLLFEKKLNNNILKP
tara:strand:+ start:453 stop:803 length:351 start_codon:yes stop_codon:yes gene_type:complete